VPSLKRDTTKFSIDSRILEVSICHHLHVLKASAFAFFKLSFFAKQPAAACNAPRRLPPKPGHLLSTTPLIDEILSITTSQRKSLAC
jgi:hypothetical protein